MTNIDSQHSIQQANHGDYFDRFSHFNTDVVVAVTHFNELVHKRHSDDVDILFDDFREFGAPLKTIAFLGAIGLEPKLEQDMTIRQITTTKEKIIQDRYSGSINGVAIIRRVYSLPREREHMPDGFAGSIIRAVRNEKLAHDIKKIKLEGYQLLGSIAFRQYADNASRQQNEVVYLSTIKTLSQLS